MLGIDTGNPHFNEWYMDVDATKAHSKPLAKLRDYVEIVRAVVAGRAGEPVRYQGPVHAIRWRAQWNPIRPSLPVYLSASGPNMVRLAGEVADGVGIGIMSSTTFLRDIVAPNARAGALMPAGRMREAMDLVPDEIIAVRVPQRDKPTGMAAYEELFELASITG